MTEVLFPIESHIYCGNRDEIGIRLDIDIRTKEEIKVSCEDWGYMSCRIYDDTLMPYIDRICNIVRQLAVKRLYTPRQVHGYNRHGNSRQSTILINPPLESIDSIKKTFARDTNKYTDEQRKLILTIIHLDEYLLEEIRHILLSESNIRKMFDKDAVYYERRDVYVERVIREIKEVPKEVIVEKVITKVEKIETINDTCAVCLDKTNGVFDCGHLICEKCSKQVSNKCMICRKTNPRFIKFFSNTN